MHAKKRLASARASEELHVFDYQVATIGRGSMHDALYIGILRNFYFPKKKKHRASVHQAPKYTVK
jgi:hypothetical protein